MTKGDPHGEEPRPGRHEGLRRGALERVGGAVAATFRRAVVRVDRMKMGCKETMPALPKNSKQNDPSTETR